MSDKIFPQWDAGRLIICDEELNKIWQAKDTRIKLLEKMLKQAGEYIWDIGENLELCRTIKLTLKGEN